MANNIGDVVSKFTRRLDQVVATATKTADLNMNQDLLGEYQGNGEIKIASIAMDGLGDYDRTNGFPGGDVSLTWETYKMEYDRGREFSIDTMDDEEREMIISANVMNEFAREKVVPEVDAIRFARIAANAGNTAKATLSGADETKKAIITAEEALQDAGVNISDCLLYVNSTVNKLLRESQPYHIGQGEAPNTRFETFDEMKKVVVPQARFYTAIDTYDGITNSGTDERVGGYVKDAEGVDIEFIVMHPAAVAALQRHEKLRYFAPDTNQEKDAHKWQYRLYHDLLVYLKKKNLIYLQTKSA